MDVDVFDGRALGLVWVVPFIGLLLSIAVMPWVCPGIWHRHFGKIALAWVLAFLGPCALAFGPGVAADQVARVLVRDFLPFLVMVGALYTITGGIRLTGTLRASPLANTAALAGGTVLASLVGSTGAAMLLIRPLLHANHGRRYRAHLVIFLIFLVCNIGGALSPLGNPPLFLGFLQGVDFFWTFRHLAAPTALMVLPLLALFYAIDLWCWRHEPVAVTETGHEPIGLEGGANLVLLGAIVGVVLVQALWHPEVTVWVFQVGVALQDGVAQLALLGISILSLVAVAPGPRRRNAFSWLPMIEVAKLFGAIFVTIIPALAILQAGSDGVAAGLLAALDHDGRPDGALYFWITGLLSSLLDNAPTYLIFFHAAGGDAEALMTSGATTLMAISTGAVFMGAVTYIGNVPNFLVKAVAEDRGVILPGFFGYLAWSCCLLLPLFGLVTVVFFR